jgi:hypothetical protein
MCWQAYDCSHSQLPAAALPAAPSGVLPPLPPGVYSQAVSAYVATGKWACLSSAPCCASVTRRCVQQGLAAALAVAVAAWGSCEASAATAAAGKGAVEAENLAVMAWSSAQQFHLSANMHGGALVANYPLDVCDVRVGGGWGAWPCSSGAAAGGAWPCAARRSAASSPTLRQRLEGRGSSRHLLTRALRTDANARWRRPADPSS